MFLSPFLIVDPAFTSTALPSSKLVKITGVIVDGTLGLTLSKSTFNNVCPALISSPWDTNTSNPSPFNVTVSIPKWIRISVPLSAVIPTACLLGGIADIVPFTGATTSPLAG